MSYLVQEVPLEHVNQVWPQVEEFIADSMQHAHGELTADDVRVYVTQGMWSLIVTFNEDMRIISTVVIQYFNRVRDRVAFVIAFGSDGALNPETFQHFIYILSTNGATCVEGGVRPSVARLLRRYGFNEKHRIVGLTI